MRSVFSATLACLQAKLSKSNLPKDNKDIPYMGYLRGISAVLAAFLLFSPMTSHAKSGTIPANLDTLPPWTGVPLTVDNVCFELLIGDKFTDGNSDWGILAPNLAYVSGNIVDGSLQPPAGWEWVAMCSNQPYQVFPPFTPPTPSFAMWRPTPPKCPTTPPFSPWDPADPDVCHWTCPEDQTLTCDNLCSGDKETKPLCENAAGNPINTATGSKYQEETDIARVGANLLEFKRYYSNTLTSSLWNLGAAWRHTYDRAVSPQLTIGGSSIVTVSRPSGTTYSFVRTGTTYASQDGDVTDKLVATMSTEGKVIQWRYTVDADGSVEAYNAKGKLKSIRYRNGNVLTLTYSDLTTSSLIAPKPDLLIKVVDQYGRELNFTYDASARITSLTDPAGNQYGYAYDANNDLVTVTYPDATTKGYIYNEATHTNSTNLPHALTGIVDENANRFASYFYGTDGKAYATERAGSTNRYEMSYSVGSTAITDPLGTVRTQSFSKILGVSRSTGLSQPAGAGCPAAANSVTYDLKGNVASRTDFNGVITNYTYNARNLETKRVEAVGTAQERTVTTTWHATYRLPLVIAEPLRRTTNTYDASGNQLTKRVQATSDATGASGVSATLTGSPQIWTWTYNTSGKVLTFKGPRTDLIDTMTFSYDVMGNLSTVTNALGQVTTLSNYDLNGRAQEITEANGAVRTLTYNSRGLLTTAVVVHGTSTETTTYGYNTAGLMTTVTLPDSSVLTYSYDTAHRLTSITDSLGNSINYTLDAMGNRVGEHIKDATNSISRQNAKVMDALNRVQQSTGFGF